MTTKNYYHLLGIEQDATAEEIKQAYRKLSVKFHPDKNNGDSFLMDMFKSINEANEVLSNPSRRKKYDKQLNEAMVAMNSGNYTQNAGNPADIAQHSTGDHEQVYKLWNLYLEKKKHADLAYQTLASVNSYNKPQYVTIKKVLSCALVLLLVWGFLKPIANSEVANDKVKNYVIEKTAAVYKKPNKLSKQIDELVQGTAITVVSETNYFYKVDYKNSNGVVGQGYILKGPIRKDD
ncbi:J domain-containing protein [Spirosoma agri]|uniref:DnaJ domain-containing protein n=1 Tax=Spirosoma agri TaxID=1987381 RepID=A0A6M0IDQ9_9BACT|nr:DnaJ domain-containing protein [Spirosoma agri]NEU65947.1 DnaJ domain-containing protein [Spirosoma agri]